MEATENPLDQTTLATLDLLESRLMRIEHLLYGQTATPSLAQDDPTTQKIANLERRFVRLLSYIRVYAEILKIYRAHPDFFNAAAPYEAPSQLSIDAIQSIVIASAASFHATHSSLTAIKDSPVPDTAESAALIALSDKMRAIETTQMAQAAQIAGLRSRSEAVIRAWYEDNVLNKSKFMADVEGRVQVVERKVRRAERQREEDNAI